MAFSLVSVSTKINDVVSLVAYRSITTDQLFDFLASTVPTDAEAAYQEEIEEQPTATSTSQVVPMEVTQEQPTSTPSKGSVAKCMTIVDELDREKRPVFVLPFVDLPENDPVVGEALLEFSKWLEN